MYEGKKCPNFVQDSPVLCSSYCSQTNREANGTVTFNSNLSYTSGRMNCIFDIVQVPGSHIRITKINLTLPCSVGFLEIRDGPNETLPLMGRFCDEITIPGNFQSSGNQVFIRYKRYLKGYLVTW